MVPDAIAGYIETHELYLQEGFTSISITTIYRAIHYNLLNAYKNDTKRMFKFYTESFVISLKKLFRKVKRITALT